MDRDGVINVDCGYVHRVKDFRFIPGVFGALKRLSASRFKSIIVTDQSGIGRGYYSKAAMEIVHRHMLAELSRRHIRIDMIYYCPHAPEHQCLCRKPGIELVLRAQRDFGLDLRRSYFIGDKRRDIQTGKNAECKTILVMTGKAGADSGFDVEPDYKAKSLKQAVDSIFKHERQDKNKGRDGSDRERAKKKK